MCENNLDRNNDTSSEKKKSSLKQKIERNKILQ